MMREPVIVDGKVTGYNVTTDLVYTTVRDMRGYESIVLLRRGETVFEAAKRQLNLIDED